MCDLLDELERLSRRSPPLLQKDLKSKTNDKTIEWLRRHQKRLNHQNVDGYAIMEMFRPQERHDRHYGIDAQSLEQIISRVLNLPKKHMQALQEWRVEGTNVKLSACVEKVLEDVSIR